jgi:hypothetical protein
MSSVTIYAPQAPSAEIGPGGRLYAAFLAGRAARAPACQHHRGMRYDDNRQDLAGRVAESLASVL